MEKRIRPGLAVRDASLVQDALLPPDFILPMDVTSVARDSGLLSEIELLLTENYDATALLRMLAAKQVSAADLLTAFRKRATIAQQCTNCLTELLSEAIADAEACDKHLAKTGEVIGPLHGLPVSFKEHISIANHRTNGGFVAWVDNISTDDAGVVQCLKKLGAVVFARTTMPQSGMQLETSNNIYGVTVHPRNRQLTSGGSTGGEAALMAMFGSPLGVGGDIGGSIRVPTSFNGLYGFMPTPGRISGYGVVIPTPGNDSIYGTLGPLARSLRDIRLFCDVYSSTQPWVDDVFIMPTSILSPILGMQLDETRPLRVGIIADDGVVSPLPPVKDTIKRVYDRLCGAPGIRVVPYTPFEHEKAWQIVAANYLEDGGSNIEAVLKEGEEPLLPLTEWILNQCKVAREAVAKTPEGRKVARDTYRAAYSEHWNNSQVDVIIAPTYPTTAGALGDTRYWGYSAIWNLLQYPAVSLPAASLIGYPTLDALNATSGSPKNATEAHYQAKYSAELSTNMPVGIQVVAKSFNDTLLLRAAEIIEDALKR